MTNQMIALQARAPSIPTYNELVYARDQNRARQNAMAVQEQTLRQQATAAAEAAQAKAALRSALQQAQSGDISGAEKAYGLGAGNLEVHKTLTGLQDEQFKQARARLVAAGAAALSALDAPNPQERQAVLQQQMPMLLAAGWKPEEISKFSLDDRSLKSAVQNAIDPDEAIKSHMKSQEPYTLTPGAARFTGSEKIAEMPATLPQGSIQQIIGADGQPQFVNIVNGVAYPIAVGGQRPTSGGVVGGPRGGGASVDALLPAIVAQESRGNYTLTSPKGAMGAYQVMPATAKTLAGRLGLPWRPELMTSATPEAKQYQDAIGRAAVQEAVDASGGDIGTAAAYYHGGSNRAQWGPKTRQYVQDVQSRLAGGGAAQGQIARPAPSATQLKIQEKEQATRKVSGAIGSKIDGQIKNIDALLNEAGLDEITGNWRGSVPGSLMGLTSQKAANALAKYKTIVANATLTELQELKATSPTGGALGAVSDAENEMLRNAAATLDRAQDLKTFKAALIDYKVKLQNAKARLLGAYQEDFGHGYDEYQGGAPAAPRSAAAPKRLKYNPATGDFE